MYMYMYIYIYISKTRHLFLNEFYIFRLLRLNLQRLNLEETEIRNKCLF